MIRGITETSLKYRFLVVMLAAVLLFAGVAELRSMPVDTLPEFAPPYVEIQTEALGLSAAEVETLVSMNLEALLNGTPWLQTIRSKSVPGLSSLLLIFEPGTDIMRARQLVEERLALAHTLPNVSRPPVILQPLSATSRVMMIGLSSESVSPIEMSILTRWNIRPALMGVPGVANVAVWGMRERQMQVLVNPEQLKEKGVTLQQVIETTGNALWVSPLSFLHASTTGTGGWIDTPNQRLGIRHLLPISTPEELAQVTIANTDLRLGEVAQVTENHQPLIGDAFLGEAVVNDSPGLILVIEKFPGSNTVDVTRGVEERLNALRPGLGGITINTHLFRPATFIEIALANLGTSLIIATLLLIAALLALLYDWRAALVSLVTVPLSLIAAAVLLHRAGQTMNTMILAGLAIALGLIIDDAIVGVENFKRRLRETDGDHSIADITQNAMQEVRGTLIYASLMVILVVLPVYFIQGVSGAFYQPLVLAYTLAVLASMFVAMVVTPALILILYRGTNIARREAPFAAWIGKGYGQLLKRVIRVPHLANYAIALLAVLLLVMLPFIRQQSFLPAFQETDVMVEWEGPPGTSHPEMQRLTGEVAQELKKIPGVANVSAHLGRAVLSDQVSDMNSAKLWVRIEPSANRDATLAAIQDIVAGYPGFVHDVRSYLQDTLSQAMTGSSKEVVVRVYGPELDVLRQQTQKVRDALSQVEGVVDLEMEPQVNMPEIQIKVDLARAEEYGLKPGDVRRAAATLLAGLEVGNLFEEQKVFEVVVWSTPEVRHSLTSVRELLIDTPNGGHVRLAEVADVIVTNTPNVIHREAVSRRVDVGFNVQGRDLGSVMRDVDAQLKGINFPLEYHPEVLGEYAEQRAAQQQVLIAAVAALVGIFLLLQACFENWRLAALYLFILPFTLVGGLAAVLVVSGGAVTLGAVLGFLTIFGIAARNGILLIDHYQRLENEGGMEFGPELVLRGSRERVAPILITAITTGLVLLPLVIGGNIPGLEIVYPMTIVILGGLLTSTLLNLFVVPSVYLKIREEKTTTQSKPAQMQKPQPQGTAA